MATDDPVVAQGVPDGLWEFMRTSCGLPFAAFHPRPGDQLPDLARRLLVHGRDMTSTLAEFHGSLLSVEVLQSRRMENLYLREVFLRTVSTRRIVEYGVLAVALEQFTTTQRAEIESGQTPLGALLHRFQIPFVSAPISFFSATAPHLASTALAPHAGDESFGRLNLLAKRTGEPLAWILEILPPA